MTSTFLYVFLGREKIAEQLQDTPIIQGILGQAKKAAKSDVGKKAKEAQNKINDTADEAHEFWETSQNPWVYRVSNIYDGLFGETEMSTAVRYKQQDAVCARAVRRCTGVAAYALSTFVHWFLAVTCCHSLLLVIFSN